MGCANFLCGAMTFGTPSAGCNAGQVCCLAPGSEMSNTTCAYKGKGAMSTCETPMTASGGLADQCPGAAGVIQLCGVDSDCGPGYTCDHAMTYCVAASGGTDGGGSDAASKDGGSSDASPEQ
jgi:hypothetical protein